MLDGHTRARAGEEDEWVIYQRPKDFMRSHMNNTLVAMAADAYNRWAQGVNQYERDRYPLVAHGLTETQAHKMVNLTKQEK
jgi:hypothetical protein